MLLALTDTKKFDKILLYFPVRGYSFLPCDRDFSIIKRALKKRDRIYNVHELTEIIANASRTQKFQVREVYTIKITNFKAWWSRFYKKNAVSLETRNLERIQKVHFNITKFHCFVYDSERSGTVRAAEFIKGVVEHTFDLNRSENNIRQCIKYVQDPYKGPLYPLYPHQMMMEFLYYLLNVYVPKSIILINNISFRMKLSCEELFFVEMK
nr:unnamed protein product [Callosobruchus chinensis]